MNKSWLRNTIRSFEPYKVPEIKENIVINANESPYNIFDFPAVKADFLARLDTMPSYHYPDPFAKELRAALADYVSCQPEEVLVGSGGDEIISLIINTFINEGDTIGSKHILVPEKEGYIFVSWMSDGEYIDEDDPVYRDMDILASYTVKPEVNKDKATITYDFIDYKDFCMQVASVVGQDEVNGIINIGSGRPEKLADRVERFIKENNYHIQLKYGAFPDRPYDSKAVWGDGSKIAKIMGK